MPDILNALQRLASMQWNGLPVATLVVLAIGAGMYLAMSIGTRGAPRTSVPAMRAPGWIARRRARRGIGHPRGRVGVGYRSAVGAVHLTERELAHHGVLFGGPGSGKTTFLQLLVEASAGRQPVIIVDPKGSPALADTVRSNGGLVWTLDGKLPADLLDPRPWQVPDLLLEAEDYSAEARVFRDAAHQRALWAAWALALRGEPMDLRRLRTLLERQALLAALEPFRRTDARVADWTERLSRRDGVEDSGARDLERSLGTLLDGVAMRGSLSSGPDAVRLEDALETGSLVLFSLDVADYPHATRKIAAWVLLAMGRLARQLPSMNIRTDRGGLFGDVVQVERSTPNDSPRALLLVDEVGALGYQARHLRGLVGRARESGLAVVLATQGPSDLEAVDRALLPQVLQDTAWQLAFRQGSPHDAERLQALFGQAWVEDATRWSDGRTSSRLTERPRVSTDEWMNSLQPGDAWLRVAPVDRGWRQHRVRVAMPTRKVLSESASESVSEIKPPHSGPHFPKPVAGAPGGPSRGGLPAGSGVRQPLPAPPPDCPQELLKRVGADILAKVDERWASTRRELGPCLVWREGEPTLLEGTYGRIYDPTLKRSDAAHLVVWRRCYPDKPIPKGMTVDHLCHVTLCQRPDHLQGPVTRAENTRRRHARTLRPAESPNTPRALQRFAVALFAGIDRPRVQPRVLALDELVQLLTRFEILADKRRGRCWSPTLYADGALTRGNAGVVSVSALVFDLDRVPPDAKRLDGVCWIAHTTWSHGPDAPKWRLIVPLATPIAAADWPEAWRRARAALCPEADPACKDASREYYLPSHPAGVASSTEHRDGRLLDPSTLPELPPDVPTPELRRSPTARVVGRATGADRRRGEAYMATVIEGLKATRPGGRNAALNAAAWTLGRWVAAGALDQRDVEDALYDVAETNGLVDDDGKRQCWATIRSGLGAGLQQPVDLAGPNQ
jgi:hypothetical protein